MTFDVHPDLDPGRVVDLGPDGDSQSRGGQLRGRSLRQAPGRDADKAERLYRWLLGRTESTAGEAAAPLAKITGTPVAAPDVLGVVTRNPGLLRRVIRPMIPSPTLPEAVEIAAVRRHAS